MTKREYLKQLRSRLSQLPEVERDQVLLYWSEAIDDRLEAGMTEAEIFEQLGSPDDIALRILAELYQHQTTAPNCAAVDEEDVEDDDEEEDDDEAEGGHTFRAGGSFHIPEIHIPEIHVEIPDIPDIPPIPEIKLPDLSGIWGAWTGADGHLHHKKLRANPANVRCIRVVDHNNAIELRPAEDDAITIQWTESRYHHYETSGEGGVLSLIHQRPSGLERLFQSGHREKVVVWLPSGYAGGLELQTTNGGVSMEDLTLRGFVESHSTNGGIRLENCVLNMGAALSTSNSSIKLEDVKAADTIDARTSNGKLTLEHVCAGVLIGHTSNASISADYVDAMTVKLVTSNGSIKGELCGSASEYAVDTGTSNGSNQTPSRMGGPRSLSAHTSNGSIKLRFLAD